ncbi:hypothetical protein R3P38DRAFT_3234176 [Favolaschia claudopus]|uniref:Uncharacterized protein n=1 Tax=Favolaschia claudopus TaxID=2862362 RepID=A0AAV9ZGM2_9AGAR
MPPSSLRRSVRSTSRNHPAPPPEDHDNGQLSRIHPVGRHTAGNNNLALRPPAAPQAPLDLDKQANLQLLESLPADQIERALQVLFPKEMAGLIFPTYICAHLEDASWPVWAAYDSDVRYRGTISSFDPAVFHQVIFDGRGETRFEVLPPALEDFRAELNRKSSTAHAQSSSSSTRFHPYSNSSNTSNSNSHPRSKINFFGVTRNNIRLAITNGENPNGPALLHLRHRDPPHQSRFCDNRNRSDGRATVLGLKVP